MYDVMAIGNALVDHEYLLSDAALEETDLTKGNMTLAAIEEQQQLLAYFKLAEIAPWVRFAPACRMVLGGCKKTTDYTSVRFLPVLFNLHDPCVRDETCNPSLWLSRGGRLFFSFLFFFSSFLLFFQGYRKKDSK